MICDNYAIKGIKLNHMEQYADTDILLDGTDESSSAAIDTRNDFYKMSWSNMFKTDIDKIKAIGIGSMTDCDIRLCQDLKLNTVETLKYLK